MNFCFFAEEPLLTAIQPEVTVYVGQSTELRCEMSGINPDDITWSRIGGQLPLTARPSANILRYYMLYTKRFISPSLCCWIT